MQNFWCQKIGVKNANFWCQKIGVKMSHSKYSFKSEYASIRRSTEALENFQPSKYLNYLIKRIEVFLAFRKFRP